ncbi:MAG TPA: glycoside hydrolase family 27 protein [Verrucomicrobiae bacterium]|nr:glycoside hydrolase family 27 protein [Verrucomicrobiae bacterium]
MLAATPPMGWNSWDSFGTTVTESDVRANAEWMARNLKKFGWQYVVVDMEWFVTNPTPEGNSKKAQYRIDEYGRYLPDLARFSSSANDAGFKPLADYIHSLGLKFGIHLLRGVPKLAVEKNLPIAGSPYRAQDAADRSDTCPWNSDNFGTNPASPAAQAYYDSIARLYAGWGVDFLKVDCVASHPYKGDDIRMLSLAREKTGRPMVLSLSPGEAPIDKVDELRKYSQMWRISDDVWDLWHSTVPYPQGLVDQFPRAAQWASETEPGHWPDADMLPLGYLGPRPGWGQKARASRLTHHEQRMLLTLWCIFRSPLIMGGNLPRSDAWTVSLLTNPEVIAVDQHSSESRQVISTPDVSVWLSRAPRDGEFYLAVFNLSSKKQNVRYKWRNLGLAEKKYNLRNLWQRQDLGSAASLAAPLTPHSSVLYKLDSARQ